MYEKSSSDIEMSFIKTEEFKAYKKFAFKDDMMKLSVGFIMGNSFNKVVCGISDYLVMPVATYLASSTGQGWRDIKVEPVRGLVFEVGRLGGVFVDFLLVSIILYLIYIKVVGQLMHYGPTPTPPQKLCPHCMSMVHEQAKKCPMCTGGLIVQKRRFGSKDKGAKGS
jgi:large conductance mechanosensitive channel